MNGSEEQNFSVAIQNSSVSSFIAATARARDECARPDCIFRFHNPPGLQAIGEDAASSLEKCAKGKLRV